MNIGDNLLFLINLLSITFLISENFNDDGKAVFAQETTTGEFSTYTNEEYDITMQYPSDWTMKEGEGEDVREITIVTFVKDINDEFNGKIFIKYWSRPKHIFGGSGGGSPPSTTGKIPVTGKPTAGGQSTTAITKPVTPFEKSLSVQFKTKLTASTTITPTTIPKLVKANIKCDPIQESIKLGQLLYQKKDC